MIAPDEFGGKSLRPTPGLSRDAAITVKIAWGAAFSTGGITDSLGQS
jgi:hypothetical protein